MVKVPKKTGTTYQGHNKTRSDIAKVEFASLMVKLTKSLKKVWHRQKARNLASVVAKTGMDQFEVCIICSLCSRTQILPWRLKCPWQRRPMLLDEAESNRGLRVTS